MYDFNPYSFGSSINTIRTLAVVGIICAVIATVVICIFVMPKKKRGTLNGFLLTLHDVVNFKSLVIEKIMRVLYVLLSCLALFIGFFEMFSGASFLVCLVIMVGIPLILRLAFEMLMLFILCVQNVIEINRKMDRRDGERSDASAEPGAPAEPAKVVEPKMVFCIKCGTKFDENKGPCPNCGNVNPS